MVRHLLEAKANIALKDSRNKKTAYAYAECNKRDDVKEILKQAHMAAIM